jgi:hypothetical protein
MDRLRSSSVVLIVIVCGAAVISLSTTATAQNARGDVATASLTPRLVSAIGGGSLKPGVPRPEPSYALTDAIGGGPEFPTQPIDPAVVGTGVTSGVAPAAMSVWSTLLIASLAFLIGAGLAAAAGRRRLRRRLVAA